MSGVAETWVTESLQEEVSAPPSGQVLINAVVSMGGCNTKLAPPGIENKSQNRSPGLASRNAALARY
jgi:hypothetical protein